MGTRCNVVIRPFKYTRNDLLQPLRSSICSSRQAAFSLAPIVMIFFPSASLFLGTERELFTSCHGHYTCSLPYEVLAGRLIVKIYNIAVQAVRINHLVGHVQIFKCRLACMIHTCRITPTFIVQLTSLREVQLCILLAGARYCFPHACASSIEPCILRLA